MSQELRLKPNHVKIFFGLVVIALKSAYRFSLEEEYICFIVLPNDTNLVHTADMIDHGRNLSYLWVEGVHHASKLFRG